MYQCNDLADESVLVADGPALERRPLADWQASVRAGAGKARQRLAFMTPEHHAVRNFAVAAVARSRVPLPVRKISAGVQLAGERVREILEDLERNLFFVVRNGGGEVVWAFPLTLNTTPHRMQLSSGEHSFAACAEDAFAAAFVLERLLDRSLTIDIRSACGQTGLPLRLRVNGDLQWQADAARARHLLFVPSVDWEHHLAPDIIDDY